MINLLLNCISIPCYSRWNRAEAEVAELPNRNKPKPRCENNFFFLKNQKYDFIFKWLFYQIFNIRNCIFDQRTKQEALGQAKADFRIRKWKQSASKKKLLTSILHLHFLTFVAQFCGNFLVGILIYLNYDLIQSCQSSLSLSYNITFCWLRALALAVFIWLAHFLTTQNVSLIQFSVT